MAGSDNTLVSRSAWANRIQVLSKLHLGSPRTGHGVYRLMCITTKIYDIRRQYGGITEPRARSALLSHAHRCNTSLDTMLAAYNNTSEIELEECDVTLTGESVMSLFPVGTKVAKQFEGDDQQLEWFAGAIQRFDEDDKLYWVLYTDGDSEDMDEAEVRDAVHNYRVHLQQDEATIDAADEAVNIAPSFTSVDVDLTVTAQSSVEETAVIPDTRTAAFVHLPSLPAASEMAAAMQAMTAAAERLASAAIYIEATVQQQQVARLYQQQQITFAMPPWQLHHYWQYAMLQQNRFMYYQQQQML
eukprot:3873-Heterococcus_DN1.PRE.1